MTRSLLHDEDSSVYLAAGIGSWRWDADSGIFHLSANARRMLMLRDSDLPVTPEVILGNLHADDVAAFRSALEGLVSRVGIHESELRIPFDDGRLFWYRVVGKAHGEGGRVSTAKGVLVDITEQRRAEQMHRTFFEQPNGLHLIADLSGTIKEVNGAWQTLLGYEPQSVVGRKLLEFVHPEDREDTLAEADRLSRGFSTRYFENRYLHANGETRLLAWSAAAPDGDGYIYAAGSDITNQRAAETRLYKAAAVFDSSGEGILISDSDGLIREVNDAFCTITGYTREEAIGQHTRLLRSGRHDADFYRAMWESIRTTGVWRGEIWNRRKNGEVYPELLTITHVDGEEGGYVAVFADISKIKETEEHLQRLAHYDQLTGLPNRHLISERIEQSVRRARRMRTRMAVVFLDVDSFKNVNDSLGHAAGDRLLMTVARRLESALRDADSIGRIGGDEFLIVIEQVGAPENVSVVAEKLIEELREPIELDGRSVTVSASLGISLYPEDGDNVDALMRNADAAMYSAKEQGRDTFRFYSERMTRSAFQRVLLDSALREAIERDELRAVYQVQRNLTNGSIVGLEVLLRWHHPKLGTVPPAQFIPHAERSGLIRAIGRWVLRESCIQGARWLEAGIDFGEIAVNISASQFRDAGFESMVTDALHESGLPADRLELEITESVLVSDTEELIEKMHALRKLGIRFAIDDFGTGYSSLRYLQRMPVDRLKLDQSFVARVAEDGNDRIIATAVIALGKALGLRVIAEGIEREEQAAAIAELGCREGQGYLYGVPLYAHTIEPILRAYPALRRAPALERS